MTSVRKSPNMMSTTGRMPVIAAPSPRPVMPASEIGESITRRGPNSSTRPESTLNGVPASATSSPMTNTASSRRSSSASASFTACESEISRVPSCSFGIVWTLGEDIFVDLRRVRERRGERGLDAGRDLCLRVALDPREGLLVDALHAQPLAEQRDRVALGAPQLLLVLRAVVRAVDVADVVAVIAVRVQDEEGRAFAGARSRDRARRGGVDGARVLAVDLLGRDPERGRARADLARRRLGVVRVLVVHVVLARVDHG